MKTSDKYRLSLQNLPDKGEEESFTMDDEFFTGIEDSEIRGGDVKATVTAENNAGGVYELQIDMEGELTLQCDRCLGEMRQEIESSETIYVKRADVEEQSEDDEGEWITIPQDQTYVDLSRHLYETAALNVPLRHVHEDGECDEEMMERLEQMRAVNSGERGERGEKREDGEEATEEQETDPRWNELRKLIENNK